MSPGMYSPMREEMEPAVPTFTPLISRMMSLSFRPALSAGLPEAIADFESEL